MIDIKDFIKVLEPGWVAMDKDFTWNWYKREPDIGCSCWRGEGSLRLNNFFFLTSSCEAFKQIKPVENWKKSLIRIKGG